MSRSALDAVDLFDRFPGPEGTIATRFDRFSGGCNHHVCIPAKVRVAPDDRGRSGAG